MIGILEFIVHIGFSVPLYLFWFRKNVSKSCLKIRFRDNHKKVSQDGKRAQHCVACMQALSTNTIW